MNVAAKQLQASTILINDLIKQFTLRNEVPSQRTIFEMEYFIKRTLSELRLKKGPLSSVYLGPFLESSRFKILFRLIRESQRKVRCS